MKSLKEVYKKLERINFKGYEISYHGVLNLADETIEVKGGDFSVMVFIDENSVANSVIEYSSQVYRHEIAKSPHTNEYYYIYAYLKGILKSKVWFQRIISDDGKIIQVKGWDHMKKTRTPGQVRTERARKTMFIISGILLAFIGICLGYGTFLYTDFSADSVVSQLTPLPIALAMLLSGLFVLKFQFSEKSIGTGKYIIYVLGLLLNAFGISMLMITYGEMSSESTAEFIALNVIFLSILAMGTGLIVYCMKSINSVHKLSESEIVARVPVLPNKTDCICLVETVKKETMLEELELKLSDRRASVFESKAGGTPYWERGLEYPEIDGKKMILFIQINLSELPENTVFVREGMLQFFIMGDIESMRDIAFKAVYHKKINTNITKADVEGLPENGIENAIYFEKNYRPMPSSSEDIDRKMHETAENLGIKLDSTLSYYEVAGTDDVCYTTKLLGYPDGSARFPTGYDRHLFQIITPFNVLNIFINSKKLQEMDFSDIRLVVS